MKKIILFTFLALFIKVSIAQFTVDGSMFTQPNSSYQRSLAYAFQSPVGVGVPGGNQFYDFSLGAIFQIDTLNYIGMSEMPFAAENPNSDMGTITESGDFTIYNYYESDANSFKETGATFVGDFGSGIDTLYGNHIYPNATDTLLSTGYEFGHVETEVSINKFEIDGGVELYQWEVRQVEVDGFGTLSTTFDSFDNALRVKNTSFTFDSIFVNGDLVDASMDSSKYYNYYAQGIDHYVVKAYANHNWEVEYWEMINVPVSVLGCTDVNAANYNPLANEEDGSCYFCDAVSYSLPADTSLCENELITITASGGNNWMWNTGATTQSVEVSPDSSTVYSCFISDSFGCWVSGATTVDIQDSVKAEFWLDASWYAATDSVLFVNLSENAINYEWDFDDEGITSTDKNPKHLYATMGIKNVRLVASNDCFSDTTYIELFVGATGVEILKNEVGKAFVYPNPSSENGVLTFETNSEEAVTIVVSNSIGQIIRYEDIQINGRGNNDYVLRDDNSGIYFISIKQGKSVQTVKWIKL